MPERHFAMAVSFAKIFFDTREQFACAIRDAATARIEAGSSTRGRPNRLAIPRRAIDLHIDDALYMIARDGVDKLEDNVRSAIDEVVREALDTARKGSS
ncbi:MAG: hypothetical protein C3F11_20490 [Methylocystaceae bacterium]|nr:MAG: hypothetical protein C3F11_20490 [Methylocystaceae bacterium]